MRRIIVRATRWYLAICLISLLSIQMIGSLDTADFKSKTVEYSNDYVIPKQSSLENHLPIRIQSDSEFASVALSEGWSGNGSSNSPYIIENYTIRTRVIFDSEKLTIEYEYAIHISDTQSHFVVRNCEILNDTDNEEYWTGVGILLDNVENCNIDSCYSDGLEVCIDLDNCEEIRVTNCTIGHEWLGYSGISASSCQNVRIVNNTIMRGGIGLWYCLACNASFNTIRGSMSISECSHCIITDNAIEEGDFRVHNEELISTSNTIIENTVNGLPFMYQEGLVGEVIDLSGIGQLSLYNCTDVITKNGYYNSVMICITFYHCINCTLVDSILEETLFYLRHCVSCIISNVTTSGHYESEVEFVSNCIIENCFFMSEYDGFEAYESHNCIIRNCSFSNNHEYGLVLHHAHNNIITNCSFLNNEVGIYNSIADNNTFTNNVIINNRLAGLELHSSNGCIVTENRIYDNAVGIKLSTATSSLFYGNEIGWNGIQVIFEASSSNSWDNGIDRGNYWSGNIGERPYIFAIGARDNYPTPLLQALGPTEITYQNGTTGHQITWDCSAVYPVAYSILLDEDEIESGEWNGSDISIDIDGLTLGTYTFTLTLTEIYGHSESVSVNVIVTTESITSTNSGPSYTIYILILIGVLGVIIVVIIVYKNR